MADKKSLLKELLTEISDIVKKEAGDYLKDTDSIAGKFLKANQSDLEKLIFELSQDELSEKDIASIVRGKKAYSK